MKYFSHKLVSRSKGKGRKPKIKLIKRRFPRIKPIRPVKKERDYTHSLSYFQD